MNWLFGLSKVVNANRTHDQSDPPSSRRQLNELPDDLAAKITIHYYLDARDALLKALAV